MTTKKTYLITGGAGFIGSHLAEALLACGQRVLAIDDLSTGSFRNIQHLVANPEFHWARASIADELVMDRLASQAHIIVHLAAAVGVKLIVEDPVRTIETNIIGTEMVLKTALRYGCQVLLASTSEVYGKGSRIPFQEEDDVVLGSSNKSRWSYAASKMVDEFLGLAYFRQFGLPVVVMRFFNTVGPRQTGQYGMVVPRFVQHALRGEPLQVYGDGLQTRCFCDVADAVRAVCGLAETPAAIGQVVNIGSTSEVTILALAKRVLELVEATHPGSLAQMRADERITFVPYDQAYQTGFEDMRRRIPDVTRIHRLLGWEPELTLDETMKRVIAYHSSLP